MIRYLLFTVIISFPATEFLGQSFSKYYFGGSIGAAIPSNWGEKQFNIGFADVAKPGPHIAFDGRWFYNKRLSLGVDMSYARLGQNRGFWNVSRYGEVALSYTMLQSTIHGCYYFDDRGFMPYTGIGFGAYWLLNNLSFRSAYSGTDADASVKYQTRTLKPGFAPQAGFLVKASKRSFLFIDIKFQIIPNIKPEQVYVLDDWGNNIDVVTQNPHGHQNHWVISAGILFGSK
ncbi:MAG: hypothetical protein QM786_19760 [Breznakibacter sp.]